MNKQNPEQLMQKKQIFDFNDFAFLENKTIYSSFGKGFISTKPNSQQYSFGKAQRSQRQKIFTSKQLADIDFKGKQGSGPASYFPWHQIKSDKPSLNQNKIEKFKFVQNSRIVFGKDKRMKDNLKYYYYDKPDVLQINGKKQVTFQPDKADKMRRIKSATIKFGVQPRVFYHYQFKNYIINNTPGSDYNPTIDNKYKSNPMYSFGFKRPKKGQDPLLLIIGTDQMVGPSTYFPSQFKKNKKNQINKVPILRLKSAPSVGIGNAPRMGIPLKIFENGTYQNKKQLLLNSKTIMKHYDFEEYGKKNIQQASKQPTLKNKMLSYTFGKSKTQSNKGFFKSAMSTIPIQIRIQHPKY